MKKKVGIIIQKLNGGGAERAASNLSVFFNEAYDVHLIVFDNSNCCYPVSGTVHDLKLPPARSPFGKLVNLFKRVSAVKKIKKECGICCTVSLMDGANLVNVLSRCKKPVITSVRINMSASRLRAGNSFKSKLNAFFQRRQMRFIASRSSCVVAVSEGVCEDLNKNFGISRERLKTICNPCDATLLHKLAIEHGEDLHPAHPCIVTMGRLSIQKGQWHIIRAFRIVLSEFKDAVLYIVGDGEYKEKLKGIAADLGIADSIVFTGQLNSPHKLISESDLFVLPSNFEGMSNALLEALAFGSPCISCDCPSGAREILAPGTPFKQPESVEYAQFGILTPVCGYGEINSHDALTKEEIALAESICSVLRNKELSNKYREAAKKRILDFSPDVINKQWFSLIDSLTENH